MTAAGSDKVRDTDYTRYFACAWADVKPSLLETLDEAAPAAPTAGLEMTGHVKLADGVYQTTFSNGMRVVVNYTGQPYTGPGVHVPKTMRFCKGRTPAGLRPRCRNICCLLKKGKGSACGQTSNQAPQPVA